MQPDALLCFVDVRSTPTPSATVNMKSSAPSSSTVFFIKPEFAAFYIPFISGAVSGIAAACVGQPFDTIKVRMQTGFKMPCGAISMGAVQTLKSTVSMPQSNGDMLRPI